MGQYVWLESFKWANGPPQSKSTQKTEWESVSTGNKWRLESLENTGQRLSMAVNYGSKGQMMMCQVNDDVSHDVAEWRVSLQSIWLHSNWLGLGLMWCDERMTRGKDRKVGKNCFVCGAWNAWRRRLKFWQGVEVHPTSDRGEITGSIDRGTIFPMICSMMWSEAERRVDRDLAAWATCEVRGFFAETVCGMWGYVEALIRLIFAAMNRSFWELFNRAVIDIFTEMLTTVLWWQWTLWGVSSL